VLNASARVWSVRVCPSNHGDIVHIVAEDRVSIIATVNQHAEASLLAAAPRLLKALEDLAHVVGEQEVGEDDGSMVALAQAIDAIGEARGMRCLKARPGVTL